MFDREIPACIYYLVSQACSAPVCLQRVEKKMSLWDTWPDVVNCFIDNLVGSTVSSCLEAPGLPSDYEGSPVAALFGPREVRRSLMEPKGPENATS